MKQILAWLATLALHAGALAQPLAEAQADFKQALRNHGRQSTPGAGPLTVTGLQVVWPWWPQFYGSPARTDGNGIFQANVTPPVALPTWALAPLAEWVASQGWAAGKAPAVREARWPVMAELQPLTPSAYVVAGPAVKEGVAQYRREGGDTVARLGIDDGQASLWLAAAKTLGWGVQWRLRETPAPEVYEEVHVSAVFNTPNGAPRVWLVAPSGVTEARLQRLHWGGVGSACESWIEVRWTGAAEPAVWALLALADPAWAAGATVQRLASKPSENEAQRGELRLALPAAPGLSPLRLRASRYEFLSPELDDDPDPAGMQPQRKRGEAWGVRAWSEAVISTPHEEWNVPPPLSAAGSPRCPVR